MIKKKPKLIKNISGLIVATLVTTINNGVVFAGDSTNYYDGQIIDCKKCECSNRIETDKITVTRNGITFTSNPITLTKVNETIRTHEGSFSLTIATNVHVKSFGFLTSGEAVESFSAYNDNTVTFENCPTATYMRYNPNTKNLFFGSNSYTMFSKICNLSKANFTCCGYDIEGNNIDITFSGGGLIADTLIATPYVELEDGNYVYGYPAHSDWNGNCYDKDVEVLTSDWESAIDPTCSEWGYLVKKCPTCGEIIEKKMTEPTGHTYIDKIVEPTCENDGYTKHVCSVCGDSYVDSYTDKLGHSPSEWITDIKPSCVKEGHKYRVCSKCGQSEEKSIDKVSHSYVDEVVAPTCENDGYTKHVCSVCGNSYIDSYTDELGHTPSDWIITKNPTCTEKGLRQKICITCGKILETEEIKEEGHEFTNEVVTPTCHSIGYTISTCSKCGYSYSHSEVTKLNHKSSNWIIDVKPTTSMLGHKYKKCLLCGEILEQATIDKLEELIISETKSEPVKDKTPNIMQKSVLSANTNSANSNNKIFSFAPSIVSDTLNYNRTAVERISDVKDEEKVIIEDLKNDIIYLGNYNNTNSCIKPTINLGKEYSGYWVEYYIQEKKQMKLVAVSQINSEGIMDINVSNNKQTLRMIITDSYFKPEIQSKIINKDKSFISKIINFFKDLF